MTRIENLRCEFRSNPLGIDIVQPRLSWELQDAPAGRGLRQSAYQVQAASSKAALEAGSGALWDSADLWDSGKVLSDQSAHVVYTGKPLTSRQPVFWRVRVWDGAGSQSDWSEPATWEMGLLERSDWQAEWIGGRLVGGPQTTSPAPFVRTAFRVDQPVARARLYITALGLYEAHINGAQVGDDVFTPGWTDYHKRVQYQVYDVTGMLRPGENVLGAILGDGWYCGYVGWGSRQQYGDRPKLLARLEMTRADGSVQVLVSRPGWKVTYGPILMSDMQDGESYDARAELDGWDAAGYDDSAWLPVERFDDPGMALVALRGPTVKRTVETKPLDQPREIKEGPMSRWIFDLGQNMVGRIRIRLNGPAGETVTLRYAEVLNPDGSLYTTNLRRARATDYYTVRGGKEEVFEPRFTFHGFRYVELSGYSGPVNADTLTGVVVHSDMTPTGSFECSDPLINQLQHNIQWGQRGNFVDVPTDCPQRNERLGWTGDAQVFVRTAAFNMDVAGFFTKWTQDLDDAQAPNGAYPCVAPHTGIANPDGGPAWGDAGVICPWTMYEVYGDQALLAEHYDAMCRYVDFLAATSQNCIRNYRGYTGFHGHGDWLALDGGGPDLTGATRKDLIGTAFLAYSAHLLSRIAAVLGKTEGAQHYAGLFEATKQAFQRRFVTPDGLIAGATQTSYVLALYFDLLPEHLRPVAIDEIVADIRRRENHLSTGFVGTPYLTRVLSDAGRADVAYDLLHQTTWPSWLYSVTQGGTTIWERWDGWTKEKGFADPGMNSFNHYAYGAIGAWMYAVVAGIDTDPACPGYKHIIMRPQPGGGLTHARAELHSLYGLIRSAWTLKDGQLDWEIVVPANTRATAYVPAAENATVTLDDETGVERAGREGGAVVYHLPSGHYHFSVKA
jgi:alpha-L-rhamnosidase